jgi:hypothetical protein
MWKMLIVKEVIVNAREVKPAAWSAIRNLECLETVVNGTPAQPDSGNRIGEIYKAMACSAMASIRRIEAMKCTE